LSSNSSQNKKNYKKSEKKESNSIKTNQQHLNTCQTQKQKTLNIFSKGSDIGSDNSHVKRVNLTSRQYQIFYYLTKKSMAQSAIAKKLKLSRQTINSHVKKLESLGVIKPIQQNTKPRIYRPTGIIPTTQWTFGKKGNIVLSKDAKKPARRVGKVLKTVRDKKTGHFKGKRKPVGEGIHRDYNTVITQDGKKLHVLRVHSIAYSCSILHMPAKKVGWKEVGAPNGMKQWVMRHKFTNKKAVIPELRNIEVTFMRQETSGYNELIIYMPEKYVLEHELSNVEPTLKEWVWKARKWFQNRYKAYLSLPVMYRAMEIAREIDEPSLKKYVQDNGMLKVKTKRGHAVIDDSKKGYPEREFTSVEEIEADLHSAERILELEQTVSRMMNSQKEMMESIQRMAEAQKDFFSMMGTNQKHDIERKKDNDDRGMIS